MFRKKKNTFFGDHVEVSCEYCKNWREQTESGVCRFGLSPQPDGACGRFVYDPLKRSPKTFPPMRPHDAQEFKL
ncbi:hypothetical protein [Caproiciproducens sp. LBM24188]|nr:hypothetical protein [Oscillospiraceae bacterium]HHV32369.1 hypothetical protein [Clostridiales bacterium]